MNNHLVVHDPVKKQNNYVARVTDPSVSGGPVRMRVCANFMAFVPLDKGGRTMRVHVQDPDIAAKISAIDDFVRAETISRNAEWFDNDMDDDAINTLFRDSLNKLRSTMTVLLSDTREANWYSRGEYLDSEPEGGSLDPGTALVLDVEIQGLFFYPKKFGIRWIVRNVNINLDTDTADDDAGEDLCDREQIEECWRQDVAEVASQIDRDIARLQDSVAKLQATKLSIASELEEVRARKSVDAEWEKRLKDLAKRCATYFSGETAKGEP